MIILFVLMRRKCQLYIRVFSLNKKKKNKRNAQKALREIGF